MLAIKKKKNNQQQQQQKTPPLGINIGTSLPRAFLSLLLHQSSSVVRTVWRFKVKWVLMKYLLPKVFWKKKP